MKYRVVTKRMLVWTHVIEADGQDEAEKIALGLADSESENDNYWYDSQVSKLGEDDDSEPDNEVDG